MGVVRNMVEQEVAHYVQDAVVELVVGNAHEVNLVRKTYMMYLFTKDFGHDPKVGVHTQKVVNHDHKGVNQNTLEYVVEPNGSKHSHRRNAVKLNQF